MRHKSLRQDSAQRCVIQHEQAQRDRKQIKERIVASQACTDARATASASARSRRSARLSNHFPLLGRQRSSRPSRSTARTETTETTVAKGPRPPLPADPSAPTRCQPGEVLCGRFLRHQEPPRSHPRTGRGLRRSPDRPGRKPMRQTLSFRICGWQGMRKSLTCVIALYICITV